MVVVLTSMARTRDWRALARLNRDGLLGRMREAGATRYRIYRNARDAAQLLVVAELPDHETAGELGPELAKLLEGAVSDDRVWEPTDLDGIG